MDRQEILDNFQAFTDIDDVGICMSILDAHEWRLEEAVNASLQNQDYGTANTTTSTIDAPMTTGHGLFQSSSSDSGHTGGGGSGGYEPPLSNSPPPTRNGQRRKPIEVDSGELIVDDDDTAAPAPAVIRELHFEIHLPPTDDNSDDVCRFVIPDTESVGSVKNQFVQLQLTELTLLATRPEWSGLVSSDLTPESLAGLVKLGPNDGVGSTVFDDDSLRKVECSVTLRLDRILQQSFHHPRKNLINVFVDPTLNCQLVILNNKIRLNIHLFNESTGQCDRLHHFSFHPSDRVADVCQAVAHLPGGTGVGRGRQQWVSDGSSSNGGGSDSVKAAPDQLVTALNKISEPATATSASTGRSMRNNPKLEQLGLTVQPTAYSLLVFDIGNHGNQSTEAVAGTSSSSYVTASSSYPAFRTRSKARSVNNRLIGYDSIDRDDLNDDDVMCVDEEEDHFSNDSFEVLDMDNEPTTREQTLWSSPLITPGHAGDDPASAVSEFCERFLLRYCCDPDSSVSPRFFVGSLDDAMAATVNASTVSLRKPLFIYLHHDKSVARNLFSEKIICSPGLSQFLNDKAFAVWPWDLTLGRTHERLLGWIRLKMPSLVNELRDLKPDSFPLLIMIGKVAGRLEVLCSVFGTGETSIIQSGLLGSSSLGNGVGGLRPSANIESSFPNLSTTNESVSSSTANTSSSTAAVGSLKADAIVAQLWQALTNYQELLEPEVKAESERMERQLIRAEQEAAYEESLQADRRKDEERRRAEQAEIEAEKRRTEERELQRQADAAHRLSMAASLASEPPAPGSPAADAFAKEERGRLGIASLRFRPPVISDGDPSSNQHSPTYTLVNGFIRRRFAGTDTLKVVLTFLESVGFKMSQYKLLTTYPRRDLTSIDDTTTLSDLKFVPQETLILEVR